MVTFLCTFQEDLSSHFYLVYVLGKGIGQTLKQLQHGLPNIFPRWLYQLTLLPAIEGPVVPYEEGNTRYLDQRTTGPVKSKGTVQRKVDQVNIYILAVETPQPPCLLWLPLMPAARLYPSRQEIGGSFSAELDQPQRKAKQLQTLTSEILQLNSITWSLQWRILIVTKPHLNIQSLYSVFWPSIFSNRWPRNTRHHRKPSNM